MKTNNEQQNIPNGWKEKRLLDCLRVPSKLAGIKQSEYEKEGEFPVFDQGQGYISGYSSKKALVVDNVPAILFGDHTRVVKYIKSPFVAGADGTKIFWAKDNFNPTFLYYLVLNQKIPNTGYNRHFKFFKDIIVLHPESKTEQQKIAEILGAVDEDIAKTKEVVKAAEKLKRGLMQQLFTRGIGHMKFKETKLGNVCEFKYGFSLPESKRETGDTPVYGSNGIVDSHNKRAVKGPAIIIGRKGTIGAVTWSDGDCWPIDTTYYVESGNYDLKWLYYLLIFLRLNKMNTASGTPGLNRDEAYSRDVDVPSGKEQKEIAEILSVVDEKISVNKKLKEKLTLLKKGLMQDLLNGKVRINI